MERTDQNKDLEKKKQHFVEELLSWFGKNRRDFPWRKTKDPYKILIAEVMLQRTRADQVKKIYRDFLKEFPTIKSLYLASPERVKRYFSKLGLGWRAEKTIALAKVLVEKYGGKIPCNKKELLSIPSIGEYISSAILSFAYNKPVAVVDSNVIRVLSRYFGISPRGEGRRDPAIHRLASDLVPPDRHREFNWAVIDLAATICTPRNPRCGNCPLSQFCFFARRMKTQEKY